ncbi:hypothetical protein [Novosphingobium resinovorum]|uniref:hypothetical protein n=1 Tax=Novosphingobium resinovorum TaxID=158500 RepID=UPI003D29195E
MTITLGAKPKFQSCRGRGQTSTSSGPAHRLHPQLRRHRLPVGEGHADPHLQHAVEVRPHRPQCPAAHLQRVGREQPLRRSRHRAHPADNVEQDCGRTQRVERTQQQFGALMLDGALQADCGHHVRCGAAQRRALRLGCTSVTGTVKGGKAEERGRSAVEHDLGAVFGIETPHVLHVGFVGGDGPHLVVMLFPDDFIRRARGRDAVVHLRPMALDGLEFCGVTFPGIGDAVEERVVFADRDQLRAHRSVALARAFSAPSQPDSSNGARAKSAPSSSIRMVLPPDCDRRAM